MTDTEKLRVAQVALLRALKRIQNDKEVAYKLGTGTSTYDGLTAAFSAISGQPLEQVRRNIIPGSEDFPHETAEEILEEEKAWDARRAGKDGQ